MFGRNSGKSSTSALLQKVNSQLRGQKDPAGYHGNENDDDEDLGAYLSSLGKKRPASSSQPKWDAYGELSDLEDDEPDTKTTKNKFSGSGNKFLKKKPVPEPAPEPTKDHGKFKGQGQTGIGKGQGQSGTAQGQKGRGQQVSQSLGKASAYMSKYGGGTASVKKSSYLSDSDLDPDLSVDEDVIADVQSWRKTTKSSPPRLAQQAQSVSIESDDSSSQQIGRGGIKFLKKKPQKDVTDGAKKKDNKENVPVKKSEPQNAYSLKSMERFQARMELDSDEASMAEMIAMMSDSNSVITPRTPRADKADQGRKQPVFKLPVGESDEDESVSSVGSFKLNVMDFDDLQPVTELKPKKEKKSASSTKPKLFSTSKPKSKIPDDDDSANVLNLMGLQTVDDLLGGADPVSVASVQTVGATSEIRTEADDVYESDFDPTTRSVKSPVPLKSILSTTPRNATPRSARSRVRYSLKEISEIRSRSPSPEIILTARESAPTSVIYTETDHDPTIGTEISSARTIPEDNDDFSYSDDFSSGLSSPERTPRSSLRRMDSDAYSEDFTAATTEYSRTSRAYSRSSSRESAASYSEDFTSPTDSIRSRSPSPERRDVKTSSCAVQTGLDTGLMYHWNAQTAGTATLGPQYGMAFVDPTPIATHVVSAEALEAVSGFSPSVVALNDMLRQQLALTTQHLEMQQRLYSSYSMMTGDHQYTTLEETKQYIKKHRKPTISFKDALKQVKREMGLK